MKMLCFLLVVICIQNRVIAQEQKMQTDRPGETLSPHLTTKGYLQLEAGFKREQQNDIDYSIKHPELQLKYGLSKRFELRAEIFSETQREFTKNEFRYGLKPVELGFKANLLQQQGWRPLTTIYTQVAIPTFASPDHHTSHVLPRIKLLFENQFAKSFHLNYNVGVEWTGEDAKPRWMYSIDQEIEISKQWELFVETFAYFMQGEAAQHHIDGGISFFPNQNIKLDVFAGKGISADAPDYFISAGLSFRIK